MISEKELTRIAKLRLNDSQWLDYYKRAKLGTPTGENYRITYAPKWLTKVGSRLQVLRFTLSQDYSKVIIASLDSEEYAVERGQVVLADILTKENQVALGLIQPTTTTTSTTKKVVKKATKKTTPKKSVKKEN